MRERLPQLLSIGEMIDGFEKRILCFMVESEDEAKKLLKKLDELGFVWMSENKLTEFTHYCTYDGIENYYTCAYRKRKVRCGSWLSRADEVRVVDFREFWMAVLHDDIY